MYVWLMNLSTALNSNAARATDYFEHAQQVVFHFAKHEEAKRMMAVMDIALLLERLRDAFLADRNSLVGRSGALPFWFTNDIDMTFRV